MSEERWRLRCHCHFFWEDRTTDMCALITETPAMRDGPACLREIVRTRDLRRCVGGT
jgi:hypothetical protein